VGGGDGRGLNIGGEGKMIRSLWAVFSEKFTLKYCSCGFFLYKLPEHSWLDSYKKRGEKFNDF